MLNCWPSFFSFSSHIAPTSGSGELIYGFVYTFSDPFITSWSILWALADLWNSCLLHRVSAVVYRVHPWTFHTFPFFQELKMEVKQLNVSRCLRVFRLCFVKKTWIVWGAKCKIKNKSLTFSLNSSLSECKIIAKIFHQHFIVI